MHITLGGKMITHLLLKNIYLVSVRGGSGWFDCSLGFSLVYFTEYCKIVLSSVKTKKKKKKICTQRWITQTCAFVKV